MTDRLPLNALQAFERAARTGSFAAAAQDLGVTPTAVSQHVRHLEERFGKQVFLRRANGVELTDAGRELFLRVSGAFAELSEAAAHLKASSSRARAVISVIPSVGELWLMPRLADLADPARVQITEDSHDPVEFAARGVDIRITYGATAYPNHVVAPLFHDRMLPVAAPGFGTLDAQRVPDARLIHTQWGPTYANPQSWAGWHEALGSDPPPRSGQGSVGGSAGAGGGGGTAGAGRGPVARDAGQSRPGPWLAGGRRPRGRPHAAALCHDRPPRHPPPSGGRADLATPAGQAL